MFVVISYLNLSASLPQRNLYLDVPLILEERIGPPYGDFNIRNWLEDFRSDCALSSNALAGNRVLGLWESTKFENTYFNLTPSSQL